MLCCVLCTFSFPCVSYVVSGRSVRVAVSMCVIMKSGQDPCSYLMDFLLFIVLGLLCDIAENDYLGAATRRLLQLLLIF